MRQRVFALVTAVGVVTAVLAAHPPSGAASDTSRQGVTSTEIQVGGVAGKTNPTGRPYADGVEGVKAYFDTINEKGGLFGRKLKVVAELDDQSLASEDIVRARELVEEKKVFAVIPVVTNSFAAARYLARKGIPTFGWNINEEWKSGPNLFGQRGSFLCFTCPSLSAAFVAERIGAKTVAILAYNVPPSTDCAKGVEAAFEQYGPPIGYKDYNLSFGFVDVSADVEGIKGAGVDYIVTCMDVNSNVSVMKALRQAGLDNVTMYSQEGYDRDVIEKYGNQLNNVFFGTDFVPFEAAKDVPALQEYITAMHVRGKVPNELSLAGWIDAKMLVTGIKAAGKNFNWKSVVAAINKLTRFDAGGIIGAPINWKDEAHVSARHTSCTAYVEAVNGKFVPRFGRPGKPFVCFPYNPGPPSFDSPTYR